jgi:Flp pilus assembly protein TadB
MIAAGALLALAVTLAALYFLAPARVDPVRAVAALAPLRGTARRAMPRPPSDGVERLGTWASRRLPDALWVRTPTRELGLLRIPLMRFYGEKIVFAGYGLVISVVATWVLRVAGFPLPPLLATIAVVAPTAAMFFVPNYNAIETAGKARAEFRRALTSYVDAVALERASGSGVRQAMEHAASVCDHWVYVRLSEELARSRWSGVPPWDALDSLAEELTLPELGDVADILRLAGEEGATAWATLRARSTAMRAAMLTDDLARANADGERMSIPSSLLGVVFIALLIAPAILRIFQNT